MFNSTSLTNEINSSNYLTPGVHKNIYIKEASVAKDKNGNSYAKIDIVQKLNGQDVAVETIRIFSPNDTPYQFDGETLEQAIKREQNNYAKHFTHLVNTFVTDTKQTKFQAATLEEFMTTALARLQQFGRNTPAVIKLLPKKDNPQYCALPKFQVKNLYIVRMEDENTTLTLTPKEIEAFSAVQQRAPEQTLSTEEDDNLPF